MTGRLWRRIVCVLKTGIGWDQLPRDLLGVRGDMLAAHEGLELVTNDRGLERYEGYPVRRV